MADVVVDLLCRSAVVHPLAFLLTGHWSPRRAREDELEHEKMVERELARLRAGQSGPDETASSLS